MYLLLCGGIAVLCAGGLLDSSVLQVIGDASMIGVLHEDGRIIEGLSASRYRTTSVARKMGDERPGHQHVAREAIHHA